LAEVEKAGKRAFAGIWQIHNRPQGMEYDEFV
jgi:hypothetical protein